MPTSAILWGATYENQLTLVSPLLDLVSDRMPRAGSEWVQAPSGVEDAWITGLDYTLTCRAAFIPDGGSSPTPVSGAVSWQAFLDWTRQKNPVRFVPDATAPLFYVDGCYLVDNLNGAGGWGTLGADIKRQLTFTIRNPTVDFHRAMRGLMFEYAPGGDITQPLAYSFARAGSAVFHDVAGVVRTAAANVLRDRHYVNGTRVTLLEGAATNSCLQSQAFDSASWSKVRVTASPDVTAAPDTTVSADAIAEDASVSNTHSLISIAITITSGESLAASCFFKADTRNRVRLQCADSGTINGFRADFDIRAGTTTVAVNAFGAGVASGSLLYPLANGWYWAGIWGQINAGVTAADLFILLEDNSGNAVYTGDGASRLFAWGAQLERNGARIAPPSSYIATASATASRVGDSLTVPFAYAPQTGWRYTKLIEVEGGGFAGGQGVLCLPPTNAAERWTLDRAATNQYRTLHGTAAATVQGFTGTIAGLATGDVIELLELLFSDGSVQVIYSRNGAADVAGARTGAAAFTAAWGGNLGLAGFSGGLTDTLNNIVAVKIGSGSAVTTLAQARAA